MQYEDKAYVPGDIDSLPGQWWPMLHFSMTERAVVDEDDMAGPYKVQRIENAQRTTPPVQQQQRRRPAVKREYVIEIAHEVPWRVVLHNVDMPPNDRNVVAADFEALLGDATKLKSFPPDYYQNFDLDELLSSFFDGHFHWTQHDAIEVRWDNFSPFMIVVASLLNI